MCRFSSPYFVWILTSTVLCAIGAVAELDFTYHNHTVLTRYVQAITANHSEISKLYSIGKSVKNLELWVVELSAVKGPRLGVPNVKLIGNMHGNEATGREVLLHLIEFLVSNYPSDDIVKWLLENTRIHILPSLNPDGFEVSRSGACRGEMTEGRSNSNGFDLNRNFPDLFSANTKNKQPEMRSIVKWLQSKQFVLSASLHGGALVANYPYDNSKDTVLAAALKLMNETDGEQDMNIIWRKLNGDGLHYTESLTPDNDVFRHLALTYSKTHPTMHLGEPCPLTRTGFKEGITNGAAWYTSIGGMQDYNYWSAGCMEITLEIGCCKYPFPEELPKIWMDNKQALVAFISQAHQGIRGVIRDNTTGTPISGAQVYVHNRSISFQSNAQGEFWRILLPGNYQLEVYNADYESAMLSVTVTEHKEDERSIQTWLDIYMLKRLPTDTRKQLTDQPVVTVMNSTSTTTTTTTTTITTSANDINITEPFPSTQSQAIKVRANTSDDKESNALVNRSASLKLEARQMTSNGVIVHSRLLLLAIGLLAYCA